MEKIPLAHMQQSQSLRLLDTSISPHTSWSTSEFRALEAPAGAVGRKLELARVILGRDDIPQDIVEAMKFNSDMLYTRGKANGDFTSVSREELCKLVDAGVIGPGLTYPVLASTFWGNEGARIEGFGTKIDREVPVIEVGRTAVAVTDFISLASHGFSGCHASLVFDHVTGQVAMLHTTNCTLDSGQYEVLRRIWPHEGRRDLIYIYGSESRRDSGEVLASKIGAAEVTSIVVPTGSGHWGLVYRPTVNTIHVVRKAYNNILSIAGFPCKACASPPQELAIISGTFST